MADTDGDDKGDEAMSDKMMKSAECSRAYEWHRWVREIPFLDFPASWLIQPIPPFAGAVARFCVKHKNKPLSSTSVYLDCYDQLGIYGSPYWEVHPVDDDVARCNMENTTELMALIKRSLGQQ